MREFEFFYEKYLDVSHLRSQGVVAINLTLQLLNEEKIQFFKEKKYYNSVRKTYSISKNIDRAQWSSLSRKYKFEYYANVVESSIFGLPEARIERKCMEMIVAELNRTRLRILSDSDFEALKIVYEGDFPGVIR